MPGQFDNILDLFAKNRNSKEVEEGYEYKGYIIQIGQGDKDKTFVIDPNSEDDKIVGEFSTEDEALEWIDGDDLEENKKVKTESVDFKEVSGSKNWSYYNQRGKYIVCWYNRGKAAKRDWSEVFGTCRISRSKTGVRVVVVADSIMGVIGVVQSKKLRDPITEESIKNTCKELLEKEANKYDESRPNDYPTDRDKIIKITWYDDQIKDAISQFKSEESKRYEYGEDELEESKKVKTESYTKFVTDKQEIIDYLSKLGDTFIEYQTTLRGAISGWSSPIKLKDLRKDLRLPENKEYTFLDDGVRYKTRYPTSLDYREHTWIITIRAASNKDPKLVDELEESKKVETESKKRKVSESHYTGNKAIDIFYQLVDEYGGGDSKYLLTSWSELEEAMSDPDSIGYGDNDADYLLKELNEYRIHLKKAGMTPENCLVSDGEEAGYFDFELDDIVPNKKSFDNSKNFKDKTDPSYFSESTVYIFDDGSKILVVNVGGKYEDEPSMYFIENKGLKTESKKRKKVIKLKESAIAHLASEHKGWNEDRYAGSNLSMYPHFRDTYYGYCTVEHPTLGEFTFSLNEKDVRTDGKPWQFLQKPEYQLTPEQVKYIKSHQITFKRMYSRDEPSMKLKESSIKHSIAKRRVKEAFDFEDDFEKEDDRLDEKSRQVYKSEASKVATEYEKVGQEEIDYIRGDDNGYTVISSGMLIGDFADFEEVFTKLGYKNIKKISTHYFASKEVDGVKVEVECKGPRVYVGDGSR